ncbi:hypothetical protein BofuT4_P080530.1 [Botrytis cinerea T4]|uniref:Uncharacterized protein n=1 Tax=Botryotinia fuckeliana (strain T4) TaxID=999810 RepID=G2YKW0_BOTF4|nr:hypothetical protein BofuT4_P080530.1 [Botrytis cinerea T4]
MYHISRWKAESDARNQSSSFNRATKVRERPEEYEIRTLSPNPITRCYSTNIIITVPLQRHIESHIPFRLQNPAAPRWIYLSTAEIKITTFFSFNYRSSQCLYSIFAHASKAALARIAQMRKHPHTPSTQQTKQIHPTPQLEQIVANGACIQQSHISILLPSKKGCMYIVQS